VDFLKLRHINCVLLGVKEVPHCPSRPEKVSEVFLTVPLLCFPVAAWQVPAVLPWRAALPGVARHVQKSEQVVEAKQRRYVLTSRPEV
jgi:hypothetical protein